MYGQRSICASCVSSRCVTALHRIHLLRTKESRTTCITAAVTAKIFYHHFGSTTLIGIFVPRCCFISPPSFGNHLSMGCIFYLQAQSQLNFVYMGSSISLLAAALPLCAFHCGHRCSLLVDGINPFRHLLHHVTCFDLPRFRHCLGPIYRPRLLLVPDPFHQRQSRWNY